MSQPGAAWNYSLSTDVLGRVVEVASGQPFDVFLRERIFKPLGMVDTDFVVPDAKWSRLATVYSPDTTGGIRPMKDPESFGNTHMSPIAYYKPGKKYFSGGAGLTSTDSRLRALRADARRAAARSTASACSARRASS